MARIIAAMRPRLLFIAVLTIVAMPLAWRVFWIHPLYLDSGIRSQVERALREVAEREGWILSDLKLLAVEAAYDEMVAMHVPHAWGQDSRVCYRINLTATTLRPCDD